MQSGQFRFPKIIIWLPPRQDKTQLFCFLYAFEMTGILCRGQEDSNNIEYILVFPAHTTENFVCVLIKTDQISVWRTSI